eukprot:GHVL01020828.1.p1 GENE.GHVL01020828.1~~GHVL01020828.1.p1  ORF type:complete len:411 (+),score=105.66 GHVL01020828.1:52-1284(+)
MLVAATFQKTKKKYEKEENNKNKKIIKNDKKIIYFCGHSLGLQPKEASKLVNEEMKKWADLGVNGHFETSRPWYGITDSVTPLMAKVVGAHENEVAMMNGLTVNLHLLLVSFYKPTTQKYKILMENQSFGSDWLAAASQIEFHGYKKEEALIDAPPQEKGCDGYWENVLSKHGPSTSILLISAVNYLSGELFDIEEITKIAHKYGIIVLVDCAHAVGNVELHLHDWQVDGAVWCTYKYLNSGPGSIGGFFIHQNHFNKNLPRLSGWWGQDPETRMAMSHEFSLVEGAAGFQISNPPVLQTVCLLASLNIFDKIGMDKIIKKQKSMNSYFYNLIKKYLENRVKIVTPERKGNQVSIEVENMRHLASELEKEGIMLDVREPNILRLSFCPLYNSFADIREFINCLKNIIDKI